MSKRIVNRILKGVGHQWTIPAHWIDVVIDELGPLSALWWLMDNIPRYEKARRHLGPLRTHLVGMGLSVLNECTYSTISHTRAFEALYLQRFGEPFVADEHHILGLQGCDSFTLRLRFERLLRRAGLREDLLLVERALTLATGEAIGRLPDDDHLRSIAHVCAVVSTCIERTNRPFVPGHDLVEIGPLLAALFERAQLIRPVASRAAA